MSMGNGMTRGRNGRCGYELQFSLAVELALADAGSAGGQT
jgi:hypothetical protein